MKFGQILVYLITNISNMFLAQSGDWTLVPDPFIILMKWQYNKICQFLVVDIYHFWLSVIHSFKNIKHWKLDIIGYWVIRAGC